jgi:hypothetical protein
MTQRRFSQLWIEHPRSVGETYLEHLRTALGFGGTMVAAGAACCVHGLFPFLFVRTGSRAIVSLHERMVTARTVRPGRRRAAPRRVGAFPHAVSAGPGPGLGGLYGDGI